MPVSSLVTVSQLKADKAFMNVDNDVYGAVKVSTHAYNRPTYLLKKELYVDFIQFNSEANADEYFSENPLNEYDFVMRLDKETAVKDEDNGD